MRGFTNPRPTRRALLLGLGATAFAMPLLARHAAGAEGARVQDAPEGRAETEAQRVPFYGVHQAGVTTPRPAAGIVVAFDLVLSSLDDFERMMRRLTERAAFLTQGGAVPPLDPKLPPADSGVLGPVIQPDNLTITVALGNSVFEKYDWLRGLKPLRLQRMTQFPNDALIADRCHGDMSIQFCANLTDTNIHALRDIVKTLSEFVVVRWMQEGSVPPEPPAPDGSTQSARNFLGFRDGSANPDSNDDAAMARIVWVGADEPEWAQGGSYQAIRIIRNFVERWDRAPLIEQEKFFGRRKDSGAPLDGGPAATERHLPDYAADPEGEATPLDSHIRLANPRRPETERNLMLRRAFNYSNGVTKSGQLDQGLIFIAYQADLEKGFITVQNRLNGEPLEEYIKPVGGGYFFVLPGVRDAGDHLGATLISAARRR